MADSSTKMQPKEYARFLMQQWFTDSPIVRTTLLQLKEKIQNRSDLKKPDLCDIFDQLCHANRNILKAMENVTKNLETRWVSPESIQKDLYLTFTDLLSKHLVQAYLDKNRVENLRKILSLLAMLPNIRPEYLQILDNKLANAAFEENTIENFQKLVSVMNTFATSGLNNSRILKKNGKVVYLLAEEQAFAVHSAAYHLGKTHTGRNVWITDTYKNPFQEEIRNNPNILEPSKFQSDQNVTYYVFEFIEPLQRLVSSRALTPNQISILHRKIHELFSFVSGTSVQMQKCLVGCRNEIVVVREKEISEQEILDSGENYSVKLVPHILDSPDCIQSDVTILGFVPLSAQPPESKDGDEGWKTEYMYHTFGYYLLVMLQMATKGRLSKEQVPWISWLMDQSDMEVRKKAFDEGPRSKDQIQAIIGGINDMRAKGLMIES